MRALLTLLVALPALGMDHPFPGFATRRVGSTLACEHCDASLSAALPEHCEIGIAGAGYSGIYFAWRLAIDTETYDASDICIFEKNGRVGGRIFTVRDNIGGLDIPLDVGGYRVSTEDRLPYDLITRGMSFATNCYDYKCQDNSCYAQDPDEDVLCYKVTDAYANSQYSLPMETMLGQLKARGAHIFFGADVTNVESSGSDEGPSMTFTINRFGTDYPINVTKALFNTPLPWLLDMPESSLFSMSKLKPTVQECLPNAIPAEAAKVYASYKKAWWHNQAGLMQGNFVNATSDPPLQGRYNDGPVRCKIGEGEDGRPVYSNEPLPNADCSGALLVYYVYFGATYWTDLQLDPKSVLSVFLPETHSEIINKTHETVMKFHVDAGLLTQEQADAIEYPESLYTGVFTAANGWSPMLSTCALLDDDAAAAKVTEFLQPNIDYPLYLANHDYTDRNKTGWAAGGIVMAERVLHEYFGMACPPWLSEYYCKREITGQPRPTTLPPAAGPVVKEYVLNLYISVAKDVAAPEMYLSVVRALLASLKEAVRGLESVTARGVKTMATDYYQFEFSVKTTTRRTSQVKRDVEKNAASIGESISGTLKRVTVSSAWHFPTRGGKKH
ncbi:hypothetical protein DIPPA_09692 [Diplonema papillatum]|nr:hypothetical protein DIPPA_09692 [Diplonema papillatum]